jgi:hypothetical protein
MAGEVFLLMRTVAARDLPQDFMEWYMRKAGRSGARNSYRTYVNNFDKAYGDKVTYIRDPGLTWLHVRFKPTLLTW